MRFSAIFSPFPKCEIDAEAGIIKGVSVLTAGEAKGHDCFADETTLREVLEVASEFKGGVKVKMGHEGGVGDVTGRLKAFRVDGEQLRADLHLLKTSPHRATVIEMAQTMPEEFGLSISFDGVKKVVDGRKCLRCSELYSVDLVESPAANPGGLFETQKPMLDSKFIAKALGLSDTAPEQEIADAFAKRIAAPQFQDLAPIMAKLEKLERGNDTSAITKLAETVNALKTESETARLSLEKGERKAIVEAATREGKVVPLSDDEIYGTATVQAVSLSILRTMVTKLEKTVPLAPLPIRPITDDERKDLPSKIQAARVRAVEGFNRFFLSQTATPAN